MKQRIIDALKHAWYTERSPHDLAKAVAVGTYIGFSPFIGLHTVMVIVISWISALNGVIVFSVSCIINNPWTMVPVYTIGYFAGLWFCTKLGIDPYRYNPQWLETSVNAYIQKHIHLQGVSLLAWLIGGNVLGVVFGILSYIGTRYALRLREIPALDIIKHEEEIKKDN